MTRVRQHSMNPKHETVQLCSDTVIGIARLQQNSRRNPERKEMESRGLICSLPAITKIFSIPPKKWIFGIKNGQIWPNIGIFGPFDPMPDQKNNANKVPLEVVFPLCGYPNFCFLP